jgi:hypothetical protein
VYWRITPSDGNLLAVHLIDPGKRMLFAEGPNEFPYGGGLPFELGLYAAVGPIADKSANSQSGGAIPHELPEAHSLHPADEPEADPSP